MFDIILQMRKKFNDYQMNSHVREVGLISLSHEG
jgi:hypothetical protein